jgi:hypothetical protein
MYPLQAVPTWASGTQGAPAGTYAVMQEDGNLVLYSPGGGVVWDSETPDHALSVLVVQDDGNAVIYHQDEPPGVSHVIWSKGGQAPISEPVASAGPDQSVQPGGQVMLLGSVSGGAPPYTYSWSPTAGLDDPTLDQPTASPANTTTYTLTVTDALGQTATDTVTVWLVAFSDVLASHWAYDEIVACASAGIVTGYPDGSYRPDDPVTRDQMAAYIARALAGGDGNVPAPSVPLPTFPDVDTDHWAFRYIQYCYADDIVEGYEDGAYRPDEVVNRGQMAVYIARADAGGDSAVPPDADGATFTDVLETGDWSWCYHYVEYCAAEAIVQGYSDGTYHPEREVTRDQMAVYVARACELEM